MSSAQFIGWDTAATGRESGCVQELRLSSHRICQCSRLCSTSIPRTRSRTGTRAHSSPGQHLRTADDVSILCARIEPEARRLLAGAWSDPAFVSSYVQWTLGALEQQRRYHCRVAAKQHALLHRVHVINGALFGLTATGRLAPPGDSLNSGCPW